MIPKSFTLINRQWTVKIVSEAEIRKMHPEGYSDEETCLGFTRQSKRLIVLNKDGHASRCDLEHTFWHEFMHAIQYAEGHMDHDEEHTERMGAFLHQYFKTRKGDQ